ncbi:hypothetical protein, partial [Streptomyces sp. P17]|uniref:hypothetical protein n=1 Tax=Streptomyces sp. P17 TaxID=3074716 RepID=UPI0028F3F41C
VALLYDVFSNPTVTFSLVNLRGTSGMRMTLPAAVLLSSTIALVSNANVYAAEAAADQNDSNHFM